MPAHRSSRRAGLVKPKYTFSDDEDEDASQPKVHAEHNPLPTSPPSATPPARPHTRKRSPTHIRRPRNAFIIFRSEFCKRQKMKESGIENDHRHISRIAGHVWNNLSSDQKDIYGARAKVEKAEHKAAYPNYRYTPISRCRMPVDVKRRAQRDGDDDKLRCRQLAELLISGVEGEDFQQTAKALDQGVVQVELTQRTSQPAPKRTKRAKREPHLLSDVEREAPVEAIAQKAFSSPQDLATKTPPTTSTFLDHPTFPESGDQKSEFTDGLDARFQLAPYYLFTDDFPALPSLSGDTTPEHAPHPHMRPSVDGSLTLGQLSAQYFAPPIPSPLRLPHSLSTHASPDDAYDDPSNVAWHAPMFSMSEFSAWQITPPASQLTPWSVGADTEALLAHATEELTLCYPDEEVDFDEYITGM